ncbi:MAG: UDP-N-acetylmuramoyl-L-alanine--D-glutamate ligase, partial [Candidatus Paceibacterota bacterium]
MKDYKEYFRGKKITVMGLGLLGRGVGDAIFLAEHGAELIITDLKSEEELAESLEKLAHYPNITFHLGGHREEDFKDRDMILKSAGVPLDSSYIETARTEGIPIEMSSSLFAKLSPCTNIGITGTRGKSTITHLLYEILKRAGKDVCLGGNVRGISTLAQLPKVTEKTIMVMELDSWQLQGFGEAKISPRVAVFTNLLPDHMNYYKGDMKQYLNDKKNIFLYQKEGDLLVVGEVVSQILAPDLVNHRGKILTARPQDVPSDWSPKLLGVHNRENIAHAMHAVSYFNIEKDSIREAVEEFSGVEGRLQCIREINDVSFYNDTTATTPDATRAALHALDDGTKRTILIMGGADKELDAQALVAELPEHVKAVVLLPGTGTNKVRNSFDLLHGIKIIDTSTMEEAVAKAYQFAEPGDRVLLSPAFASFGL